MDGHPPGLAQAVAADFLGGGHLGAWIRRLRAACAERRGALVEAIARDMGGVATPVGAEAGLHLSVELHGLDDREVSRRARTLGVDAPPLASFRLEPRRRRADAGGDGRVRPAAGLPRPSRLAKARP
jgi:GntR family transcriptional regulator/MocR family aminotransferase